MDPAPTYDHVCQILGQIVLEHRLRIDQLQQRESQSQAVIADLTARLASAENQLRTESTR